MPYSDKGPTIVAQLFARVPLDADGQPFEPGGLEQWAAVGATALQMDHLGSVRFRIADIDANELAVAAGAIEPGDAGVCLRVAFAPPVPGTPVPSIGHYVVIPTDDSYFRIVFRVWLTHADLHGLTAPDAAPSALRNDALFALRPTEALLVQDFDVGEAEIITDR